jgi:hypothetical protein
MSCSALLERQLRVQRERDDDADERHEHEPVGEADVARLRRSPARLCIARMNMRSM